MNFNDIINFKNNFWKKVITTIVIVIKTNNVGV